MSFNLRSSGSTPRARCPRLARHAAVTHPTYPRPRTATVVPGERPPPEVQLEERFFMQSPTTASVAKALEAKILNRTARVGIVGLGYVGLPLAMEFARAGFQVTGIDIQASKVAQLNQGDSYVQDVSADTLKKWVSEGNFRATSDFSVVSELDTINIAVPTPLRKTKDPDMSYVVSACQAVAKQLKPGQLVILESTTYPGTTDELVLPMLERPGWKVGEDFFLCFSPERVDPGNPQY